jgi:methylenetetrahydrofolate dehydrogenase (NADP+)/methenyltetrahydrofolate cyclohydrolase
MAASIIDGRAAAAALRAKVSAAVGLLPVQPGLAVVLVGEDPASAIYVRNKHRETVAAGMASFEHRLPGTTTEADLLSVIRHINADDRVDGILVQLPLPPQIDAARVIDAIDPEKDVDGFHIQNVGRLAAGLPSLVPCTPLGCLMLLRQTLGSLRGAEALVLGRSGIVGKPMAQLLLAEDATVTVAHSRSRDLPDLCRRADILVAAVGRPAMVRGDWLRPGATVIDVGINRLPEGGLVGDVAFDEATTVAGAITPVPGGVGPMTIACLLANTLTACCRRRGLPEPEGFAR